MDAVSARHKHCTAIRCAAGHRLQAASAGWVGKRVQRLRGFGTARLNVTHRALASSRRRPSSEALHVLCMGLPDFTLLVGVTEDDVALPVKAVEVTGQLPAAVHPHLKVHGRKIF